MGKSLNGLMAEADLAISEKLQIKTASSTQDDIAALAEQLKVPSPLEDMTLLEKVAYSRAMMDTLLNLDYLTKVYELEKRAAEKGISGEKLSQFFEKKAARKFRSVLELFGA